MNVYVQERGEEREREREKEEEKKKDMYFASKLFNYHDFKYLTKQIFFILLF